MTDRMVLLLAAVGLFPVALSYGVVPSKSVTSLLGIPVESVNHTHVFRALMGLYLANAVFWISGAANSTIRQPALWGLFLFMTGLAAGRFVSIIIDGMPSLLLVGYLLIEILFAVLALRCLRQAG